MCGIAGVVNFEEPLGDVSALTRSLDAALAHRGPDGAGSWTAPGTVPGVLLVHRRLAIIDPGPGGAQPASTPDGRHHIVFNGEIYNYRALRSALESRGERFSTASDTEVLLRLVACEGPGALARVRGMFAFACWDAVNRSLLVARDRFGIKPLYVAANARMLAFASELGALRTAGLAGRDVSTAGVLAFLEWGSVPPPLTWMRGVEMLPPGTWARWTAGVSTPTRGVFADVRNVYVDDRRALDGAGFRAEVAEALRDSVRAHLVADVPVGVFLSGGIDSGAIVSCATSVGASNLQTFTIGVDDESSESERARLVAEMFGTTHRELTVSSADIARDLPAVLRRLDQPTIDAVNSYYVSRAVASTGIKAVLSGAGGDEVFGGYPSFTRLPRAMAAKRLAGVLWPAVGPLGQIVLPERLRARWRHFASTNGSLIEAYRTQRGFLLPDEVQAMAGPALRDTHWRDANDAVRETERVLLDPLSRVETPAASVARLESRMYLGVQLLRDLDVMSMTHGLEVRVPFVDQELIPHVWPRLGRYPSLMHRKRLLQASIERPLPPDVVRHPKQGFTLPFARWMSGELGPFVRDGLQRLADDGWITSDVPDRLWNDWRRAACHWSRPWGLSVLGHFLASA
jgi:asparagine synthase (glutamine-hydrolysing)